MSNQFNSASISVASAIAEKINALALTVNTVEVALAPVYDTYGGDSGLKIIVSPSNITFKRVARNVQEVHVSTTVSAIIKINNGLTDIDAACASLDTIAEAFVGSKVQTTLGAFDVQAVVLYGSTSASNGDAQVDGLFDYGALEGSNVFATSLVIDMLGVVA